MNVVNVVSLISAFTVTHPLGSVNGDVAPGWIFAHDIQCAAVVNVELSNATA